MSTINNIPFDINRTACERNASVKPGGTVPVFHSDATKAVSRHKKKSENRSGNDRRKQHQSVQTNRRFLIERRQILGSGELMDAGSENVHSSGSIIDLEV